MRAVVMAAGEGRRLRPLTERWPKPLLPIDGRPVIATLLRELAAAGFDDVAVVTGHLADQIERFLGTGDGFGVRIAYVRQPEVLGSSDAVLRAHPERPYLVTAADTVYTRGDVARFWSAFERSHAAGAIAYRRRPPPDPQHRRALRVEDGAVTLVPDDDPANANAAAPLWALDEPIAPILERLPGDAPYELSTVYQQAIDEGHRVAAIEIGTTRDLTHPQDVVAENFPYLAGL